MNAVGYIRVSTQKQAHNGVSLEAQESSIRSYCTTFGLDLGEIIEDAGASAKTLRRPGMGRLLNMVDAGEVGAIVIYKLDRAFRSMMDALVTMEHLDAGGVAFHSVTEKLDTSTAFGRAFLHILMSLAQLEREQIGERTRDALRATKGSNGGNALLEYRKAAGKLVTGQAPFGYCWRPVEKGSKKKELVVNPAEMVAVNLIRELATAGQTPTQIKKNLEARGFGARHKAYWHTTQIARIVRAEFY